MAGRHKLPDGEKLEQVYVLIKGNHIKDLGGKYGCKLIMDAAIQKEIKSKKLKP